jgi:hypothetical protein
LVSTKTTKELSEPSRALKWSTVAILILVSALLVDSLLSDVSSIVNKTLPEEARIVLFSSIAVIAIVSGSIAVLHNVRKVKAEVASNNQVLLFISRIMPYIQYTIIALLILITLQIIFTLEFLNFFLVASLALSWSTGVILMGVMSFKLIQWYMAKRNRLLLLHAAASVMFCATLGLTIVPQILITIQSSSVYVNSHSTEVKPFQFNPGVLSTLFAIISIANWMVLPLWFIVWAATAVMLSHYSMEIGRTKYWTMLAVPLASVIIATISWIVFLPSLSSIFDQRAILYTMMAFVSILASGFLLSFAFMTISKDIEKRMHTKINDYLGISAIGIALVFVSFFANPSAGSYLPFGVLSASFFAFGAYLFFSGIYASAVSIGSDSGLRQSIRKSVAQQSKLLDSIGTAHMERAIQETVLKVAKDQQEQLEEQTGIEPSLSEDDMKQYLEQVIEELKKSRSSIGDSSQ